MTDLPKEEKRRRKQLRSSLLNQAVPDGYSAEGFDWDAYNKLMKKLLEEEERKRKQSRKKLLNAAVPDKYSKEGFDWSAYNKLMRRLLEEKTYESSDPMDYDPVQMKLALNRGYDRTERELEKRKEKVRETKSYMPDYTFRGVLQDEEGTYKSAKSLFSIYEKYLLTNSFDAAVKYFKSIPHVYRKNLKEWVDFLISYPRDNPGFKFTAEELDLLKFYIRVLMNAGEYSDNPVQDVYMYEDHDINVNDDDDYDMENQENDEE